MPHDGRAVLELGVALAEDGRSRLARRRVSYPWSVGRGYPNGDKPGAVTIIPQMSGAGLIAGDQFEQHVAVDACARLHLVSAGATLVHGASPKRSSRSAWRVAVGPSARVTIASEPYVLMEDAQLELTQTLIVHEDARVVTMEGMVLAPGVTSASWSAETSARRPDGTVLFLDRQVASSSALFRISELPGSCTAFVTILVFAPRALQPSVRQGLADHLADAEPAIWSACCALRGGSGIGVRLAGSNGGRLRDRARSVHDLAVGMLFNR